ncbi:MAG: hypothetical protein M1819_006355 [Sarea resinae]|nr:MAG: hypothetical protein M1819_006355 [Sarea resinae]
MGRSTESKKRKLDQEATVPNLPGDLGDDFIALEYDADASGNAEGGIKKDGKSSKSKKRKLVDAAVGEGEGDAEMKEEKEKEKGKKETKEEKKERKEKKERHRKEKHKEKKERQASKIKEVKKAKKDEERKKTKSEDPTATAEDKEETDMTMKDADAEADAGADAAAAETGAAAENTATTTEDEKPKSQRFIVFIGNLPYTATTETITAHFASVAPTSIRHITDKGTGKSKGFAFLEFEGYDRMKTCLKLFHHSVFDDGKGKVDKKGAAKEGRRINVELTAGGGGKKSQTRLDRLSTKNEKLNEQRQRRAVEEEKLAKRKAKKMAQAGKNGKGKGEKEDKEEKQQEAVTQADSSGIHPSRLARMGPM